jgi:two-component system NtrC family sensor kinase
MISNLIGNAIKYTQPGGKIEVRATVAEGQLIFEVSDNGPGIPTGDQPFIFDKFFRGSNVNSDTQGTGLGLAIVKSIVENHQGRIWMSSALGAGTRFTVVLPVEENRD